MSSSRRSLTVAFRTDASLSIGSGHVMRCLTLADALKAKGATCLFICRRHEGHLVDLIQSRGYEVAALSIDNLPRTSDDTVLPAHTHWLGAPWTADADDCRHVLAAHKIDWLIVDHYALDYRWEQALRPGCGALMVIDDLADRRHDCDILLDQNLGRKAEDYTGFTPAGAQMFIGPRYALLRPEFAALRAESLARRIVPEFKDLLITMGGVDKDNVTEAVLDALDECALPNVRFTVVMGPRAPWLMQVQKRAALMRNPTDVLANVNDMARLMTQSDFAIGAAGGTAWERCCLGLPSIQIVLAENQRSGAIALEKRGAAALITESSQIRAFFQSKIDSGTLSNTQSKLSRAGSGITDGSGTEHIASWITADAV